jgi:hypothetical protein
MCASKSLLFISKSGESISYASNPSPAAAGMTCQRSCSVYACPVFLIPRAYITLSSRQKPTFRPIHLLPPFPNSKKIYTWSPVSKGWFIQANVHAEISFLHLEIQEFNCHVSKIPYYQIMACQKKLRRLRMSSVLDLQTIYTSHVSCSLSSLQTTYYFHTYSPKTKVAISDAMESPASPALKPTMRLRMCASRSLLFSSSKPIQLHICPKHRHAHHDLPERLACRHHVQRSQSLSRAYINPPCRQLPSLQPTHLSLNLKTEFQIRRVMDFAAPCALQRHSK